MSKVSLHASFSGRGTFCVSLGLFSLLFLNACGGGAGGSAGGGGDDSRSVASGDSQGQDSTLLGTGQEGERIRLLWSHDPARDQPTTLIYPDRTRHYLVGEGQADYRKVCFENTTSYLCQRANSRVIEAIGNNPVALHSFVLEILPEHQAKEEGNNEITRTPFEKTYNIKTRWQLARFGLHPTTGKVSVLEFKEHGDLSCRPALTGGFAVGHLTDSSSAKPVVGVAFYDHYVSQRTHFSHVATNLGGVVYSAYRPVAVEGNRMGWERILVGADQFGVENVPSGVPSAIRVRVGASEAERKDHWMLVGFCISGERKLRKSTLPLLLGTHVKLAEPRLERVP